MSTRTRLALEFSALFIGVPLLSGWQGEFLRAWVIPQLLAMAGLFLIILWRDPSFDRPQLRAIPQRWQPCLTRILVILLLGGAALAFLAAQLPGVRLFSLPRRALSLWLLVLLLYPLVSALAQELIFRVFLFHRYGSLFGDGRATVLASAGAFALAHIQLGNPVAPVLAFLGGLLFAYTYQMTRSLPMVVLEHGLWGDWLFTLGLGKYFYGGHY